MYTCMSEEEENLDMCTSIKKLSNRHQLTEFKGNSS